MIKRNQNPIFILILFLLFGCEKWSDSPNAELNGLLLKIENEDNEIIEKYVYDRNNNLKSSWHKFEHFYSGSKAEYNYTYNSKELLIEMEGFEPGNPIMSSLTGAMDKDVLYYFEYDTMNRLIKKIAEFDYYEYSDINYSVNYNYEYIGDTIIIERTNIIDELSNSVSNVYAYHLNDKGNIIKKYNYLERNSANNTMLSKEEYQYDNKKAPRNADPFKHSINNVTALKTTAFNYDENEVQTVAYSSTYLFEYTYNSEGYPERMKETWPNDQIFLKYYFYKN